MMSGRWRVEREEAVTAKVTRVCAVAVAEGDERVLHLDLPHQVIRVSVNDELEVSDTPAACHAFRAVVISASPLVASAGGLLVRLEGPPHAHQWSEGDVLTLGVQVARSAAKRRATPASCR